MEPRLSLLHPGLRWLWGLSIGTWTAEGTYSVFGEYILEAARLTGDPGRLERMLMGPKHFGFDPVNGFSRSFGALIGLGFLWRFIAFVALYFRLRKD